MSNPPIYMPDLANRFLDVIEHDVLPLTEKGVAAGNKIFGAALVLKSDLSLVLAETNNERDNPLWHGEMHLLKRFYEMPAGKRPTPKDLWFISTHEPCSLCMSAITWAGFDNFWYFFSHEDSRDAFAIPHDLKILKEVFRLEPGGYAHDNAFWSAHAIKRHASKNRDDQITRILARYERLSVQYQASKSTNAIPLK
jgi:tRNA(Arg) A34 adenosine deaminase TadA